MVAMFRARRYLALASLLAACIGTASARAETIFFYGDSLTAGYLAPPGEAYPDFLKDDLQRDGYHVDIQIHGFVNMNTTEALQGLPEALPALIASHPDIVVLEFGGADAMHAVPVSQIESNLRAILRPVLAAHIRVVLVAVELPPAQFGDVYSARFRDMYAKLAREYRLPLVPSLMKDVYTHPELMNSDGIHPNGDGYQHVALNVLPVVEPMLRKQQDSARP